MIERILIEKKIKGEQVEFLVEKNQGGNKCNWFWLMLVAG